MRPARRQGRAGAGVPFCGHQAPTRAFFFPFPQLGVLGSGTYGLVIRARDTGDPDAQDVAIKLLPRGGFVSAAAALLPCRCLGAAHPAGAAASCMRCTTGRACSEPAALLAPAWQSRHAASRLLGRPEAHPCCPLTPLSCLAWPPCKYALP